MPDDRARLPDYCAGAMFVQQLLSRGYGFDERSFGGVTFQKKVGTRERRGGAAGPSAALGPCLPGGARGEVRVPLLPPGGGRRPGLTPSVTRRLGKTSGSPNSTLTS